MSGRVCVVDEHKHNAENALTTQHEGEQRHAKKYLGESGKRRAGQRK